MGRNASDSLNYQTSDERCGSRQSQSSKSQRRHAPRELDLDRQICHYQNQCLLLSKLPYEIRRQIWTTVVGGDIVHITRTLDRMSHIRCNATTDWIRTDGRSREMNWIGSHSCWGLIPLDIPNERGSKLDLLVTCRRLYVRLSFVSH